MWYYSWFESINKNFNFFSIFNLSISIRKKIKNRIKRHCEQKYKKTAHKISFRPRVQFRWEKEKSNHNEMPTKENDQPISHQLDMCMNINMKTDEKGVYMSVHLHSIRYIYCHHDHHNGTAVQHCIHKPIYSTRYSCFAFSLIKKNSFFRFFKYSISYCWRAAHCKSL